MTDALWQEQSKCKLLESDLHDMRLHVHGLDAQLIDLQTLLEQEKAQNRLALEDTQTQLAFMRERQEREEMESGGRLIENAQRETNYYKDLASEHERYCNVLQNKVSELERALEARQVSSSSNEGLIGQYSRSIKDMQDTMVEMERQIISLREQNLHLQQCIEKKGDQAKDVHVLQAAFEDEHSKRRIIERELEQLKNEMISLQQLKLTESNHFQKALDDIRGQLESEIKNSIAKDDEIRSLHKERGVLTSHIEGLQIEVGRLNDIARELNDKNKRLNEKLNEVIFGKAATYKQKA